MISAISQRNRTTRCHGNLSTAAASNCTKMKSPLKNIGMKTYHISNDYEAVEIKEIVIAFCILLFPTVLLLSFKVL